MRDIGQFFTVHSHNLRVQPRCLQDFCLRAMAMTLLLAYPYVLANHLAFQQITSCHATGGYQDSQTFFLDQQGLLSQGPGHLHYQVQCQPSHCTWQAAKWHYVPRHYRVALGYDKRFQSHVLSRQQPFFGLVASFPNDWAPQTNHLGNWRPWLGLVIPRAGVMQITDPIGTLQQTTVQAGSHLLSSSELPLGAYPIDVSVTDQNGQTETTAQFVNNQLLANHYQHEITRLTIGFPTNQAAASAYGLPPITTDIRELLINLQHRFHARLGTTQTTLNLQKQQLALGVNHMVRLGHTFWQPELLWMQGLSSQDHLQRVAIGLQAQGLAQTHMQWQILATTYPRLDANLTLPWVIHGQMQWLYANWLAGLTGHLSEDHQKRYVQAIIHHDYPHPVWQPSLSLSARAYETGFPALALTVSAKEKNRLSWTTKFTNQQQRITATYQTPAQSKYALSVMNQSTQQTDQQRIALSASWQDALAKWHLAATAPLQGNHSTWSIQAKTGLVCTHQCLLWTPLQSVKTPAILRLDSQAQRHFIHWGDRDYLRHTGVYWQKKRSYSSVPAALITAEDHANTTLYPGNVYQISSQE